MELRSHRLRVLQPSASTSRPATRRRAQARPDQGPSPPKRQCFEEEEGECRASPTTPVGACLCHALGSPLCHAWGDNAIVPMAGCRFCKRADNDPNIFGETFQQGTLQIHENCMYHASELFQHGNDDEGFYGFLLPDIQQELQRVAQKKCCICGQQGASVRCRRRKCFRTFHFPCGRERGCISQFFGEYRSFCWRHAPKQKVRLVPQEQQQCTVCMEAVEERPGYNTLVCPSCKTARFHRHCIQSHALSAALYHFCCPLCRDMETFQAEMLKLGIKIPNRNAAWEDEESFLDLSLWYSTCSASVCLCPHGQEYTEDVGPWRFLICQSCGSCGTHEFCSTLSGDIESWECSDCSAAGTDVHLSSSPCTSMLLQCESRHSTPAPGTLAPSLRLPAQLQKHPNSQLPAQPTGSPSHTPPSPPLINNLAAGNTTSECDSITSWAHADIRAVREWEPSTAQAQGRAMEDTTGYCWQLRQRVSDSPDNLSWHRKS
ncbi:LOW QUALITY PROTEIN: PHD finger protein 7-like [Cyrtonyx montezumae]|uniref:LOW QUALITY PROTEIN: PHD finger protein 7-like n=1 Tax=Cyrtonyx montezumae TaxID=9017 RepID=UPI0032DB29DD